jgi:hypothetical protein
MVCVPGEVSVSHIAGLVDLRRARLDNVPRRRQVYWIGQAVGIALFQAVVIVERAFSPWSDHEEVVG